MRVVCPQDVKKKLNSQVRMVNWKKWKAKHECEELTGGVWLEPVEALLRREAKEAWTDNHRNVMRKLVVEGGWVPKTMYDKCWSDVKVCGGCNKEEGTEIRRLYHSPSWREVRNWIPEGLEKWEHCTSNGDCKSKEARRRSLVSQKKGI